MENALLRDIAADAPEIEALEYMFIDNPAREIFVTGYPAAKRGLFTVPNSPGLGLELDLDVISTMSG